MLIKVLGPLEVRTPDGWQRLGAQKWRTLLARLTLSIGSPVSVDALMDDLWPDVPPAGAVNQVHGYVSRMRSLVGDRDRTLLVTRSPGYELMIDPDDLDSLRFERLTDQAQVALRNADHPEAARLFGEALDLWRGPAYADVPAGESIRAEADRLEERRLRALEGRIDANLGRGRRAAELVTELQSAVAAHPLRERFWAQLMLALYRSDRQSEALLAYQEAYRLLDSELGVQPGAALTALQQQILACDPALDEPADFAAGSGASPAEPEEIPRQLAADIADFTGREPELAALNEWLEEADSQRPSSPGALALSGGGGFGKTTLGLHWAHLVADRFPDGQLYVNLRGFASVPALSVEQALSAFLGALGVPIDRIPVERDEAAALFRTRISDRRMLIFLDNAADDEQVLPLLPGSGPSRVLITSRDPLPGLVARGLVRSFRLGALTPEETEDLLARIVGRSRRDAEPTAISRLAKLCAGLPLATRITGAQLAGDPDLPVADHVAELEEGGVPQLAALDLDPERPDDPSASVRAAFNLSFARLGERSQRLFALLSLIPGDSFSVPAAAALIDHTPSTTRQLLDQLCARGMLTPAGRRRYALHDLLRTYAADRRVATVDAVDQKAAAHRLFGWYLATAAEAVTTGVPAMSRLPDPVPGAEPKTTFDDPAAATGWLEAEHSTLRSLAADAEIAADAPVWQLSDVLRPYYFHQGNIEEWLAVADAGVRSARRAGHPKAEASAELSLTQAYRHLSRYADATRHAERAHELAEESGWQPGVGLILNEFAILRIEQGDIRSAPALLERAIGIHRSLGDHRSEAALSINLGLVTEQLGDLDRAEQYLQSALNLLPPNGWQLSGLIHATLGSLHRRQGRLDQARVDLDTAEEKLQGVASGIATAWANRASLDVETGDLEAARASVQRAWERACELQNERLRCAALVGRAEVKIAAGDPAGALVDAVEAEELTRRLNTRYEWIQSLSVKAQAELGTDRPLDAHRSATVAAEEAERNGYRIEHAQAEAVLAEAELRLGNDQQGYEHARRALALHRECGSTLGEQQVLRRFPTLAGSAATVTPARR